MSNILLIIIAIVVVIVVIIGGVSVTRGMKRPKTQMISTYQDSLKSIRDGLDIHPDDDADFIIVDNRTKKEMMYIRDLSFDTEKKVMFTAFAVQNGKKTGDPKWEVIPFREIQDCVIKLEDDDIASVKKTLEEDEKEGRVGGQSAIIAARKLFDTFKELKTIEHLSIMFPRNNENAGMYVLPLISSKTTDFLFDTTVCEQVFAIMYAVIEENIRGGYIISRDPFEEEEESEDEEDS